MTSPCYHFDEFELDCDRFELRHNGRTLKLERIPMELLIRQRLTYPPVGAEHYYLGQPGCRHKRAHPTSGSGKQWQYCGQDRPWKRHESRKCRLWIDRQGGGRRPQQLVGLHGSRWGRFWRSSQFLQYLAISPEPGSSVLPAALYDPSVGTRKRCVHGDN
jgi:hypothetical protein